MRPPDAIEQIIAQNRVITWMAYLILGLVALLVAAAWARLIREDRKEAEGIRRDLIRRGL